MANHSKRSHGFPPSARLSWESPEPPSVVPASAKQLSLSGWMEPATIAYFRESIIPGMFERKKGGAIRTWVVGCGNGAGAYALAMLLDEFLAGQNRKHSYRIFATDGDEEMVSQARKGCYSTEIEEQLPEEWLAMYFSRQDDGYLIKHRLRQHVFFSFHELIKNTPFSHLDLIRCERLPGQLTPALEQQVLEHFQYSLNKDGILQIEQMETGMKPVFEVLSARAGIFQLKQPLTHRPGSLRKRRDTRSSPVLHQERGQTLKRKQQKDLLERSLLEAYAPDCLVVNRLFDVLYLHGAGINRYLSLPKSCLGFNLLNMISPDHQALFSNGVKKALHHLQSIEHKNIDIRKDGKGNRVNLRFFPLFQPELDDHLVVIEFCEQAASRLVTQDEVTQDESGKTKEAEHATSPSVRTLQLELNETREQLDLVFDELELANEELALANQELQDHFSDLEVTNEELHRANEEYRAINEQLNAKIEELRCLSEDMDNLLVGSEIGTIFLDEALCIRRFTPAVTEHFSLMEGDQGRSIEDFRTAIGNDDILADIRLVREEGCRVEKKVRGKNGRWFLERIIPFEGNMEAANKVVITFFDIHELHKTESRLKDVLKKLKLSQKVARIGYYETDLKAQRITCSEGFCEIFGIEGPTCSMEEFVAIVHPADLPSMLAEFEACMERGEDFVGEYRCYTKTGDLIHVKSHTYIVSNDEAGKPRVVFGIKQDITDQKQQSLKLRRAHEALERSSQEFREFAYVASHDMKAPISNLKALLEMLVNTDCIKPSGLPFLEKIQESVLRMSKTIRNLNEVLHLKQNIEGVPRERLAFQQIFEDVHGLIEDQIKATGAVLYVDFGACPEIDYAQVHLQSIIQNLLTNAIKYRHPDRHPVIHLRSLLHEERCLLLVKDNGLGIDMQEYGDKLFGLFQRFHEGIEGSGIGLHVMKSIVESSGGTIEVKSRVNEGTTFYVYLT